jgi:protein-S-isoprenylcysteine O-methyltransferase Ste14
MKIVQWFKRHPIFVALSCYGVGYIIMEPITWLSFILMMLGGVIIIGSLPKRRRKPVTRLSPEFTSGQ